MKKKMSGHAFKAKNIIKIPSYVHVLCISIYTFLLFKNAMYIDIDRW